MSFTMLTEKEKFLVLTSLTKKALKYELFDDFYNVVDSNSLYIISNGHIQVTNKKYSSLTNPFEFFLQKSSTITPSPCVDSIIPMHSLHIMSIDSLLSFPINSLVDVLGIFLFISPASTIHERVIRCEKGCTNGTALLPQSFNNVLGVLIGLTINLTR